MSRRSTLLALVACLIAAAAVPATAAANPPDGSWTFVRRDAFKHYACKVASARAGSWTVRTATWFNGRAGKVEQEIGVYATIAKGSDDDLGSTRDAKRWRNGYIFTTLPGAADADRVWIQGSYYGPAAPWSDGYRISRLRRCSR